MATLIVEELNRIGHVVNRHKVQQLPATIGRGFDNDVILDDQYISPLHSTVTCCDENTITIEDNSLNGIEYDGQISTGTRIDVESGHECILGHTRLRLYSSNHKVPEARPIKHSIGFASKITKPLMLSILLILYISMLVSEIILTASQELTLAKGLTEFFLPVTTIILWAAAWTFVGRLIKHQTLFLLHIGIVLLFLITSNLMDWLAEIVEFNLIPFSVTLVFEMTAVGALLMWLISNHLRFSTSLKNPIRLSAGFLFSAGILGVYYLEVLSKQSNDYFEPPYSTVTKAPYAHIRGNESADNYLKEINAIFDIEIENKNK